MEFLTTWNILGILALLSLIVFFSKGKNAVWGGLSLGAIVGLIIGLINLIKGNEFDWIVFKNAAIIGTLIGVAGEILAWLFKKRRS